MLVEGEPDADVIESAWQSALRDMGLGRVHVDEEEGGYSHEIWSGDPPAPLVSRHWGSVHLMEYLEAEINRPFLSPPVLPYRAFALQTSKGCYLGVVYQQWVADSVAVRLLMREWFVRVFQPTKARKKLIDLPRIRTANGPELGYRPGAIYQAGKLLWDWRKLEEQLRTFPAGATPSKVTLADVKVNLPDLDDLMMVTRAEGCTVNDLLIALLAAAMEEELRSGDDGDIALAIATSVDLRPHLPGASDETYGSLLEYLPIICKLPSANRLNLAQEVARQTRALKDPEQIACQMALPRMLMWLAERRHGQSRTDLMQRHAKIAGSLANVSLNKSWPMLYYPGQLKRYVRVSPPNPVMPLAICTTNTGGQF